MSFMQELTSWTYGKQVDVKELPRPGVPAPSTEKLPFPRKDGKPALVTFLRHCGCPFAERDFVAFRELAAAHSGSTAFIAVSHSEPASTEKWLEEVGGRGQVEVLVDDSRQLYADWGLGPSGWTHVLSVGAFQALHTLGKEKGIWNRPTESGSRWQTGGNFAVDSQGKVAWVRKPERADDQPGYEEALQSLGGKSKL